MEFEEEFQAFLQNGGFATPCVREDLQREAAQNPPKPVKLCKHGNSPLRCSKCYFEKKNE
jgi:hypothetical protein